MRFQVLLLICLPLFMGACPGCSKKTEAPGRAPAQNPEAPAPQGAKGQDAGDKMPRKIIYTANISLVVEDFAKAEQDLRQLVAEHNGYVINSEVQGTPGSPRFGQWKVRVPVEQFDTFRTAVSKLGELERTTTDSQNVTEEYYDTEARIKTQKAEEQSLLKLLEKSTGKLEDILAVRRELSRVREEIERHQGRLQLLTKLTAMTTVTIILRERGSYVPPEAATFSSTIAQTFFDSWNMLVGFLKGTVLVVVALAPWLGPLAVLGILAIVLRRRLQKSQ
jgi:hypothetical protein